jgi:hypothetical protein
MLCLIYMSNIEGLSHKGKGAEGNKDLALESPVSETAPRNELGRADQEASIAAHLQEQQVEDSQKASTLLNHMKERFSDQQIARQDFKPGDKVFYDGEFHIVESAGPIILPLLEGSAAESEKRQIDGDIEKVTRANLSGKPPEGGEGGGLLGSILSSKKSPLENRATEYDSNQRSKDLEAKKDHRAAQEESEGRSLTLRSINAEARDEAENVPVSAVSKATPEMETQISEVEKRRKQREPNLFNPFSWNNRDKN